MIIGDKVLGVIANYHQTKEYEYSEDDLKIFESMANLAAIALENVRLYKRQEDLVMQQKTLIDIGKELTSKINVQEEDICALIYQSAKRLMSVENFSIAFCNDELDEVRFPFRLHEGMQRSIAPRQYRIGKTGEVIRTGETLKFFTQEDVKAWEQEHQIQRSADFKIMSSWVGVPIKIGKKVLGVIATYHLTQEHAYTEDQVNLLQSLANYVAIALENARLYKEIEQQLQKVQNLAQQLQNAEEKQLMRERFTWITQMSAEFAHKMVNVAGTIPARIAEAREQVNIESSSGKKVMKQLEAINRDVTRLITAAQEIRQTTKSSRTSEYFVIRDIAEEAVRDVWQQYPELSNNVKVEKFYVETPLTVSTDKIGIQRIFTEIIQNALEAMEGKGTLTIIERPGQIESRSCIDVIFSNTGVKIPENTISKIFDLFYTTKEAGLGVALSQGKSLMKFLGGDIEVESMEGETSFTVKIPAKNEEEIIQ